MHSSRKTQLEKGGIDVNDALERFMGNDALLERFLKKFLSEKSYEGLVRAIEENDPETARVSAHSLKSVCGTIGCTAMRQLVLKQEQLIKNGQWDQAVALMPEISENYQSICAVLKEPPAF